MTAKKAENLPAVQDNTTNFLEVISKAARDPNVDVAKMHGLLDVQERMMNKQAEISFNNALADLQGKLPRIKKDAKIAHNSKLISTYATYEAIDDIIRPLLIEHGFSLRFNSKEHNGKVIISGTLAHRDGHSITDEIPLSIDSSGAKNNVQGVGSTISYGKRYIVSMLLNLVFEGEDDDGRGGGGTVLADDQAAEIKGLLQQHNMDVKAFLNYMGADSVDQIAAAKYEQAIMAINRKISAGEKK